MGVGPLHSIDEVAEGNEVMEKRERQDGITTEQAKGRTLRWQPLLPNLRRVNEAAINPPQVRPETRFSELAGEAACNQEYTGGLQQGLDNEAEAIVAQRQASVLKHPGIAALDRPAVLSQP